MQTLSTSAARARRLAAFLSLALLAACGGSDGDAATPAADRPGAATSGDDGVYRPGPPLANPEGGTAPAQPPAAPRAQAQEPSRTGGTDVDALGFTRGSPDAPVRVVEFSDFGCGYCRQFHEEAWPTLRRDYVETGRVEWKMVPFDVGMFPHARQAVLAGECAGEQDRFDDLRERLFAEQRTWKSGSAGEALSLFRRLAGEEDLDMDRFNRCMAQGWRAARVDASNALARQLGIRGTPTFYILGFGIVPGALPADQFAQLLDEVLARRAGEPGS